jgi:hypothetical protein
LRNRFTEGPGNRPFFRALALVFRDNMWNSLRIYARRLPANYWLRYHPGQAEFLIFRIQNYFLNRFSRLFSLDLSYGG